MLGGTAWNIHYRGADNQKHNHTTIILSTPLQFNKTLSFLAAPNIPIPSNAAYFIFIGPRSDQSLLMSLTDWLTDWRPCWRLNELTFIDGIKYLSDVDIEMKLRFSCQQLKTSGKACKAGNSCNSCQSWRQWIDLCWWNQISKRCCHWNEIEA